MAERSVLRGWGRGFFDQSTGVKIMNISLRSFLFASLCAFPQLGEAQNALECELRLDLSHVEIISSAKSKLLTVSGSGFIGDSENEFDWAVDGHRVTLQISGSVHAYEAEPNDPLHKGEGELRTPIIRINGDDVEKMLIFMPTPSFDGVDRTDAKYEILRDQFFEVAPLQYAVFSVNGGTPQRVATGIFDHGWSIKLEGDAFKALANSEFAIVMGRRAESGLSFQYNFQVYGLNGYISQAESYAKTHAEGIAKAGGCQSGSGFRKVHAD